MSDFVDLRLPRGAPARVGDLAGVTVLDMALVTLWIALDIGLVGDDAGGESEDLAGVPRVERGVGEVGSGNCRG